MPPLRGRQQGARARGELAGGARRQRSSDGIDGTVLETSLDGSGAAFCEVTSGASVFQSRSEGAQERFWRHQTAGAPPAGRRVDAELRTGAGTTDVANHDAGQTSADTRSGAPA